MRIVTRLGEATALQQTFLSVMAVNDINHETIIESRLNALKIVLSNNHLKAGIAHNQIISVPTSSISLS